MKLTQERINEIAYKFLIKKMASERDLLSAEAIRRGATEEAKKFGVAPEEAVEFMHQIIPHILAERLGCKEVSLVWK